MAVRTASTSASAAASFASGGERLVVDRHRELVGERSQQPFIVGRQRPAEQGRASRTSVRASRSGSLGRVTRRPRPTAAIGVPPASCASRRAPVRSNVERICSTSRWTGSGSAARLVVDRTSASASRRARRASSERREATSTSAPTTTATTMNTTSEIRFSVRPIVNVAVGEDVEPVDEQRGEDGGDDPDEQTADRGDGQHDDERQQQLRRQIDRVAERHGQGDEHRQPDDHEQPSDRRAATHGRCAADAASVRGSPVSERAMTWTSMSGARRVTRATNDPWTSSCHRLRRLAPSTSWVAFSRAANDAIASAVSWRRRRARCRRVRRRAGVARRAPRRSVARGRRRRRRAHRSVRRRRGRPCAPRGGSARRRRRCPVRPTTTRSRVSHASEMPWASR